MLKTENITSSGDLCYRCWGDRLYNSPLNPDSSWLPSSPALSPTSCSPPLGRLPDSKSRAKCVNQHAGKYRLWAERAWEGNVTPTVTVEQKKQAVAFPLSTPWWEWTGTPVGRRQLWVLAVEKKHGRDMLGLLDLSEVEVVYTQTNMQYVSFIILFIIFLMFIWSFTVLSLFDFLLLQWRRS